ncbi:MAG: hypothetical protein GF364_16140 [Candidatus Lokiarchaeota archaeon]|nr:hypothetical protein [Candidatus Lokiarchaeota archaeon]
MIFIGSTIKRKFYSTDNELLCVLSYVDFSTVLIEFPNPELVEISKDLATFKTIFLESVILYLKKQNKEFEITYSLYNKTNFLESIALQNLTSIEDYNLVTEALLDLLNEIKGTIITSKIERKFYSKDNKLLSIISFLDFNRILISFMNAHKLNVQVSSEELKTIIQARIVDQLKTTSPHIKATFDFYNDTEIIENIELMNVGSVKDYNFVSEKIMELLSEFEKEKV